MVMALNVCGVDVTKRPLLHGNPDNCLHGSRLTLPEID
jgi:hypothetical protein